MERNDHVRFARRAASGGMVLLKNDGRVLPLDKSKKIALLGRPSYTTLRLGWGSGNMCAQTTVNVNEGLESAGATLHEGLDELHKNWTKHFPDDEKCVWTEWDYGHDEVTSLMREAARECSCAVVTVCHCIGESEDLALGRSHEGYQLTENEEKLLALASKTFPHTVLVLNTCNPIDTEFLDRYRIDAVLYAGVAGEEIGNAAAEILLGDVCPSGKLSDTWAMKYEDYPTTECFSGAIIPYKEGIYVGYRYFDTFGVVPRYPFGYGLSYTKFRIHNSGVRVSRDRVTVAVTVKNTGKTAGREVVQCYLSAPDGKLEKPYQDLCAFAKTKELAPGESEKLTLSFSLRTTASYDEKRACYLLEAGEYVLRVGNSSRNTHVFAVLENPCEIVTMETVNRMPVSRMDMRKDATYLSKKGKTPYTYDGETEEIGKAKRIAIRPEKIRKIKVVQPEAHPLRELKNPGRTVKFSEVVAQTATAEEFVGQMSNIELALMVNGVLGEDKEAANGDEALVGKANWPISGIGGCARYIPKYDLPATGLVDGPAGVRLGFAESTPEAKEMVAYPSATTFACGFDTAVARLFGENVRAELRKYQIACWLAPGMNIHRNPLNGRNFEYFSEDPLLSGKMAAAITDGVQIGDDGSYTGYCTTIKHFAVNNSEHWRFCCNALVSERALREIYLRGFEIAVRESQPKALMTSYNLLNGRYTATDRDLISGVLRAEWGYRGMVMTDWDILASSTDVQRAGTDLVMPGSMTEAVRRALDQKTLSRAAVQQCALRVTLWAAEIARTRK